MGSSAVAAQVHCHSPCWCNVAASSVPAGFPPSASLSPGPAHCSMTKGTIFSCRASTPCGWNVWRRMRPMQCPLVLRGCHPICVGPTILRGPQSLLVSPILPHGYECILVSPSLPWLPLLHIHLLSPTASPADFPPSTRCRSNALTENCTGSHYDTRSDP